MKKQPTESASGLCLVSHVLCPYVQRAAILLIEKGVPYSRIDIDLADKPAWFLAISPLGRTPLLLVDEAHTSAHARPLFESAAICEYLDETSLPRLHPAVALDRARHRGWMEFGSALLNDIWGFYMAVDPAAYAAAAATLHARLRTLESGLHGRGPWFAGDEFRLVDAVFAPVFRYFDAFAQMGATDFGKNLPRITRWRAALAGRPSVQQAVAPDFGQRLLQFLRTRTSELARRAVGSHAG